MSTRGAIGMRYHGVDKITYNHADSYPKGMGKTMVDFIQTTPVATMQAAYTRLQMVDLDSTPTTAQARHCIKVGAGNKPKYPALQDAWYWLLHNEQGKPESWVNGSGYMIDSAAFMADSVFNEWSYIINLDDRTLEAYTGPNQNPLAPGRYSHLVNEEYNGVYLLLTTPLSVIQEMSPDMVKDYLAKLED